MRHYPHHIGDFDKATRHLTRIERSVYRDLLDTYYDTERALTLDLPALCRKIVARSNEEATAVQQVLNEFFTETPTGWYHDRCEAEIAAYHANTSQKAMAGKASAAARLLKKQQALNGKSTHVERPLNSVATAGNGESTNQSTSQPVNQEPDKEEPAVLVPEPLAQAPDRLPPCPTQELVDLYHHHLPMLPRVEVLNDGRRRALSARWREVVTDKDIAKAESPKNAAVDFFGWYFGHASRSAFLTGRAKNWRADFDFLITPSKFAKVIEGHYHKDTV